MRVKVNLPPNSIQLRLSFERGLRCSGAVWVNKVVGVLAAMCLLWGGRDSVERKGADQDLVAEVIPLSFSLLFQPVLAQCLSQQLEHFRLITM